MACRRLVATTLASHNIRHASPRIRSCIDTATCSYASHTASPQRRTLRTTAVRHARYDEHSRAEMVAYEEWRAMHGSGRRMDKYADVYAKEQMRSRAMEQHSPTRGEMRVDMSRYGGLPDWITRKLRRRKHEVEQAWNEQRYDDERGVCGFASMEEARVELMEYKMYVYDACNDAFFGTIQHTLWSVFPQVTQLKRLTKVDVTAEEKSNRALDTNPSPSGMDQATTKLLPDLHIELDADDVARVLRVKRGTYYSPEPLLSSNAERFQAHFEHQVRFFQRPDARLNELKARLTSTTWYDKLEREVDRVNRNLHGKDTPSLFTPPSLPPPPRDYDDLAVMLDKLKPTPNEGRTLSGRDVPRIARLERLVAKYPDDDARFFALLFARHRVAEAITAKVEQGRRDAPSWFDRLRATFG